MSVAPVNQQPHHHQVASTPAVIDVAIDARRLGHPLLIPHTLLEQAAPGYLTDHDWDAVGDDWLDHALADTA
ncbi:hypothetical protein ABZS66_49535 [Dactylosporangium sp. NPDC005572]|uniref:hypothetical protein n=1 Tax=Dactylosporangium sp. NPDC005572 TaxID=3156889 RepID=UPI0033AE8635